VTRSKRRQQRQPNQPKQFASEDVLQEYQKNCACGDEIGYYAKSLYNLLELGVQRVEGVLWGLNGRGKDVGKKDYQ
jgi:hypothetical protein